ncbi:MAG: peptidoglycan DD-metalloendopeptidase family protein [Nevskia sp.]|nr:peptidoglycan DD-metalloendopeptidase family protein [Nevskia sp.]
MTALVLAACSTPGPEPATGKHSAVVSRQPTPSKPTYGETYVVSRGDTLYSIAFRNQLDYHDLADWNGIGRDYLIVPGQVLRLSPPGRSPLPGSVPAPTSASTSPQIRKVSPPPAAVASAPAAKAATNEAISTASGEWEWPTRGENLLRKFDADGNKGLDIGGELGQIVIASRSGKVVYSGSALKGYGELIIIKHDEDYLTAYGYSRRRLVMEGDTVAAGQPIAELGLGPEQRPLLHFEIRNKGRPVDPLALLPKR